MIWNLFLTFLKIGTFTFGGGYAMIPLIEDEIVNRKKWLTEQEFTDQFAIAQSVPGPFSLNTAVFVGYRMRGVAGSVAAVTGLVLPSFVILFCIAAYLSGYRHLERVEAAFRGIRPCVVALIAVPFYRFVSRLKKPWKMALALAVTAFLFLTGCSPVWFILAAVLWGMLQSNRSAS